METTEEEVKIVFSRHALRRIKLYGLNEINLRTIIQNLTVIHNGYNEIVQPVNENKYPIKIVFKIETDYIVVVTAYPLKRGRI
jgi:hypothetical protein